MQPKSNRRLPLTFLAVAAAAAVVFAGTATSAARAKGTCTFPTLSQPFTTFGDSGNYFLAPGGNLEGSTSGWLFSGGAGGVEDNESYFVGSRSDSHSFALPTTSASVTTPTMCVTSDAPTFRMFIKNNGNLGHIDGQLAVYLNFTGADGKPQQVKIAALKVKNTAWTLSPKISFIQYISTPLKDAYANVSFTIKPNDNHGNWQVDDFYVDPYCSR